MSEHGSDEKFDRDRIVPDDDAGVEDVRMRRQREIRARLDRWSKYMTESVDDEQALSPRQRMMRKMLTDPPKVRRSRRPPRWL